MTGNEGDPLLTKLTKYVTAGAHSVSGDEQEFIEQCLEEAITLVDRLIGTTEVPADIRDRMIIETGSELYQRRQAPQGVTQLASGDGGFAPVKVSRDPLSGARLIFRPWNPGGFA